MSSKSSKVKIKKQAPRPVEEINREFSDLIGKLGNANYLIYVYQKEAEALNKQILSLNQEAAERKNLDTQAAEQAKLKAAQEIQTQTQEVSNG